MKKYIPFAFATLLAGFGLPAMAQQNCEVTVESNDAMQYDVKEITADKSCKEFTIHLKHVGKLPVAAMGHNWVLTTSDDVEQVAQEGIAAGADNDYLKPDDNRILAHTDLIGGGEETSVTFDLSKLDQNGDYMFFCSFPGHSAIMRGDFNIGDATGTQPRT